MAPPPLRVGATVDGSQMTITFSQRASARKYNDYLKTLGDSFYETQQCGYSASKKAIFMSLPQAIATTPPSPDDEPNGVPLTFEDKAKAIAWEEKMILWKRDDQKEDDGTAKTQLSLVTVWKVDVFQSKLGLSKHDSDHEQGIVFGVGVLKTSVGGPRFSYGRFKQALRSRLGEQK